MMCDSVTRSQMVTVTRLPGLVQRLKKNMKERDFSMLLLQTFRKDKVKAIVERLVDVLAAEMIKISQMTTL